MASIGGERKTSAIDRGFSFTIPILLDGGNYHASLEGNSPFIMCSLQKAGA
jgi:hypothetical protein